MFNSLKKLEIICFWYSVIFLSILTKLKIELNNICYTNHLHQRQLSSALYKVGVTQTGILARGHDRSRAYGQCLACINEMLLWQLYQATDSGGPVRNSYANAPFPWSLIGSQDAYVCIGPRLDSERINCLLFDPSDVTRPRRCNQRTVQLIY